MELVARVIQILPLEQGVGKQSGNPWSKATIIVETEGQYPKKIALSNMKNVEEFAKLPIGSIVKFSIDIESREYQGRYFTNVSAYKWEVQGQQAPQPQQAPPQQYPQQPYAPSPQSSGYQQPPQGYTQGHQQPPQQADEEELPF